MALVPSLARSELHRTVYIIADLHVVFFPLLGTASIPGRRCSTSDQRSRSSISRTIARHVFPLRQRRERKKKKFDLHREREKEERETVGKTGNGVKKHRGNRRKSTSDKGTTHDVETISNRVDRDIACDTRVSGSWRVGWGWGGEVEFSATSMLRPA